MATPSFATALVLLIDGSFLVVLTALVWRELALGGSWHQMPVAALISLYAGANIFYHLRAGNGEDLDLGARMALALLMVLLTLLAEDSFLPSLETF
jgi:uncharacterized protein involved in response to NO